MVTKTAICPNGLVYPESGLPGSMNEQRFDDVVNTPFNPTCVPGGLQSAVVKVNVPEGCSGVSGWVEYEGVPEGWTLNIGDSLTNNGFGGDSGTLPAGQNAELQILNEELTVFGAISAPPNDRQILQTLALKDGGLRVNVKDQFVSWSQGYTELATPEHDRLFFLPEDPGEGEDRTLYVGLNRVIHPFGAANGNRNGCGLRRALLTIR